MYFNLILIAIVLSAAIYLLTQYRTHALDASRPDERETIDDPATHETAKAA